MSKAIITVVGRDTVGIIAKVCTFLADNHVNILSPMRVFPWVRTAYLPVRLILLVTVGAFVFTASLLICTTSSSPMQRGFFPIFAVKIALSASFIS